MTGETFANEAWQQGFTGFVTQGDLPSAVKAIQSLTVHFDRIDTTYDFARLDAWGYIRDGRKGDIDDRRREMIGAVLCAEIVGQGEAAQAKFVLPAFSTMTYQLPVANAIGMIHGLIGAAQFDQGHSVPPWDTNGSAVATIDRLHTSMTVAQGFGALPGFRSLVTEYRSQLTQPLTAFGRTRQAI